ncbi:MAG TPA: ABC transporter permease [Terracidiphilus sp.]|nr:ABC transporter permease [Terracidiphilus sp.]
MQLSRSRESIRLALDTLRKNKLRSALTVLGISIGIATVILISSAINGLNTNIDQFIRSLGTNALWVYRFEPFGGRPSTAELNRKQLTYEDSVAMRQLPHVTAVDAALFIQDFRTGLGGATIKHGAHKIQNTVLQGDTTDVKETANLDIVNGRLWTESEEERAAHVVVLGSDSAADLFPGEDPIGKDIDCEGGIFTVIGVLDKQPQPFGSGRNAQDNSAFFPLETFRLMHPEIKDFWITVKYDDPKNKSIVLDSLRELLRRRRAVRVEQDDNFAIFGPDSLTRLWNSLTGGLFLFMVAVSSVGLIVGGVGVMNIMLVSVTERTREIGIRKAIGATRKNILLQFTLEAVTLCLVGGVLGILTGALLTLILHFAVPFLHAALSAAWVIIAFVVAAAIGLLFGIYPAWKAASLDPIEALRYE